jgi:hypothetical protein
MLEKQTSNRAADRRRSLDRGDFESDFPSRVSRLLASVDYRRADSRAQREAIGRLRDQAYRRESAISVDSPRMLIDGYDEADNGYVFGLYVVGELASSLRLHVGSKAQLAFPSLEAFPEYLQPELDVGKVLVDTTCFVADERLSRCHRDLPYVTLRLCILAAEYFEADQLLAAVSAEHQAFYRRAFGYEMVCEPRPYPQTPKLMSLMTVHFPSAAARLYQRYPFFCSSPSERQKLFERQRVPTTTGQQAPVARDQEARKDPTTDLLGSSALAGS